MVKYSSAKLNLNVRSLIHGGIDGATEIVEIQSFLNF